MRRWEDLEVDKGRWERESGNRKEESA